MALMSPNKRSGSPTTSRTIMPTSEPCWGRQQRCHSLPPLPLHHYYAWLQQQPWQEHWYIHAVKKAMCISPCTKMQTAYTYPVFQPQDSAPNLGSKHRTQQHGSCLESRTKQSEHTLLFVQTLALINNGQYMTTAHGKADWSRTCTPKDYSPHMHHCSGLHSKKYHPLWCLQQC